MNRERIIRLSYYGVFLVVLLVALYMFISSGPSDDPTPMEERVDMLLRVGFILALVVVGVAILAFAYNIARNFKQSRGMVVGVIGLLVIFAIAYAMAVPDLLDSITNVDPTDADKALSKMTGAGLKSAVIVGSLTILASLYFSIRNIFN